MAIRAKSLSNTVNDLGDLDLQLNAFQGVLGGQSAQGHGFPIKGVGDAEILLDIDFRFADEFPFKFLEKTGVFDQHGNPD